MKRLHSDNIVERANRDVPIHRVIVMTGTYIDGEVLQGTSRRIWCPFSLFHPDGGKEREMRVYSDGKAYCHRCKKQYTSVSLAAQWWSISYVEAATRLVSSLQDSKDDVLLSNTSYVLRAGAVAALGLWADTVGVLRTSSDYVRCLRAAEHITEDCDVAEWLTASKKVLSSKGH